jgi:hypothetical protein
MPNDPKAIQLGPGKLYVADAGTVDPTVTVAASKITWTPGAAWSLVGYTENGSEISFQINTDPVEVAEVLDPLYHKTTGRAGSVSFEMAEETVRNLTIAWNGGTVTVSGTGVTEMLTYEPPLPGNEVRRALIWVSEDEQELWLVRQTFQTGNVTVARRKGADKATLPVEMSIEAPASGGRPFKVWMTGARSGGAVASA